MSVTGTLDGYSIDGFVRSLRRVSHICAPGQHATLLLSSGWTHSTMPGKEIVLYEDGIRVLTGYTIKTQHSRPSYDKVIEADDTYTRVTNYFIDSQEVTTAGHDTSYWTQYILDLCGSTYNIFGTPAAVPAGIQIGLRPANEALKDVIAYASWYVWADKNGVLQIGQLSRNTSARTITEFTKFEVIVSDDTTRNVVKVFGLGSIRAVESVAVPGIYPDRIAVVGSPLIATNEEASRVAQYLIGELGDLTRIFNGSIRGIPQVRIGNCITMTATMEGVRYSVTDTVTSLESNYDISTGYEMEVTIGERCPRIAGWSTKIPYTYAGLDGNGVYVSRDKGVTWAEMNTGLPDGSKVASRVAGNSYGEALALVNGSNAASNLYYEIGNTWTQATGVTGTVKAIGALAGLGQFAVLTGSQVWLSTPSSGSAPTEEPTVSSGSIAGWTPTYITTTDFTTGSTLYGSGIDMYTKTGTAYVNAVTGSSSGSVIGDGFTVIGTSSIYLGTLGTSGGFYVDIPDTYPIIHWIDAVGVGASASVPTLSGGEGTNNKSQIIKLDGSGTLPFGHAKVVITASATGNPNDIGIGIFDTQLRIPGMAVFTSLPALPISGTVQYDSYGCGGLDIPPVVKTIEMTGSDQAIPLPAYFRIAHVPPASVTAGCVFGGSSNTGYDLTVNSIQWVPTSGSAIDLYPISSGSYNLYTVSEAGSILVSDIPAASNTNDRLYVSDDGEVFIYNTNGRLLVSDDFGMTFHSAYPSASPTKVPAVTRAQMLSTELITSGSFNTVIGGVTGTDTSGSYQGSPESSGGWSATGALPSGFVATDAIWSDLSTQGVLMGGGGYATKIFRLDPPEPPFATISASDSGIPSADASNVLDLEFGA